MLETITLLLAAKYAPTVLQYLKNAKTRDEIISKLPKVKSLDEENTVDKLKSYYKNEKLVLVLGAGVSMSYGLPDWNTLLQKLMINTIEKEPDVSTVLSKLFTSIFSPSPLIAGRYLQEKFSTKVGAFEKEVQRVLYETIEIEKPSKLMDEIVKLCVSPGKSPNLDSIITYNFDDILEQKLESMNVAVPFKPIYGIGVDHTSKQLPIYHVHGYLPQKGELNENNQITFGESIYHKQYIDIYSWNNIVQINKFRDSNCLFIGTSLTDPNTRRLLDIAKKQKGQGVESHIVFKLKYSEKLIKKRLTKLLEENTELSNEKALAELNFDETIKFLIEIIERFEEADTASLGVKTMWLNDWDEAPPILEKVRLGAQSKT